MEDPIFEMNRSYYNGVANDYHNRYKDELERKPYDKLFLDLFLSLLPARPTLLDVGCGSSCQQGVYLSGFGSVNAIDLSPKNIAVASQAFSGIEFSVQNMISTNFVNGRFDGLCAMYSMIHLPRLAVPHALIEFHRILKPGGVLAIAVHEKDFEGVMDNQAFDENSEQDSVYFKGYLRGELDTLLEKSGFTVQHSAYRKRLYEFEYDTSRIYILASKNSNL